MLYRAPFARCPRSRSAQHGFTIMELLVALGVTMIGLAGLMTLYSVTARANRGTTVTTDAMEAAAEAVEELRGMSVAQIEGTAPYAPIDASGWGPVDFHGGN